MNQDLLRHFQAVSKDEQHVFDALKDGTLEVTNEFVVRADGYLQNGQQIVLATHPRLKHHPEHTHEFVEMVYMCSGQTTHLVNGTRVVLRAGELLILNQHARQEILPAGLGDIAINFIILPQFFTTTLGMMGDEENNLRRFLLSCLQNKDQADSYLHFKVSGVLPVQNLVENMLWSLANDIQYRRSINQFTMGLLFLHLFNHTDKAHTGSKQDVLTLKILQYVDERYADGSLNELAKLLGYNMTWLSREIGRLTGSTFRQLQQNRRIAQAKFLLSTTKHAVVEVAKQVGYSNSTHFYQLFQQQVGCTPAQYKKMAIISNGGGGPDALID